MERKKTSSPHIGIFGRRNNGKSSLINYLTKQEIAIVSEIAGTTTDPVKKSYEITGYGSVILIDTAGIDDEGTLGVKRIAKSLEILKIVDLAILVISQNAFTEIEEKLIFDFEKYEIPFIIIHNKNDLEVLKDELKLQFKQRNIPYYDINVFDPKYLDEIISKIKIAIPESSLRSPALVGDLLQQGDIVLLITPIDIEAPEGRLILPQVQTIRDILDNDCISIVLKEREVDHFLRNTNIKPKLAITDSQIFLKADASIPKEIPLTSFSILFARYRGNFDAYLQGTPKLSELKDGDRVLVLESCTHHVSCDDIGRVKIPRWLSNFSGKKLDFDIVAGLNKLDRKMTEYAMVIQCGGCMITRKQLNNRLKPAIDAGIPISNYGMAIAFMHGIYPRAVAPFTKLSEESNIYL